MTVLPAHDNEPQKQRVSKPEEIKGGQSFSSKKTIIHALAAVSVGGADDSRRGHYVDGKLIQGQYLSLAFSSKCHLTDGGHQGYKRLRQPSASTGNP